MEEFVIIASIVIAVGVGALLAVAIASQIKRVKAAIANTEVGEEITVDSVIEDEADGQTANEEPEAGENSENVNN